MVSEFKFLNSNPAFGVPITILFQDTSPRLSRLLGPAAGRLAALAPGPCRVSGFRVSGSGFRVQGWNK